MAKYKLLSKVRLFDKFWVVGEIYDSTLRRNPKWRSVEEMARINPNAWELIPEEKLPENWCIMRTKKNASVINEWNNNLKRIGESFRDEAWSINSGDYFYPDKCHNNKRYSSYTEITFDQFKRLVLREQPMKEKEIIGYKAPFDFTGTTDFVHKGDVFTREDTEFFYTNNGLVKKKNKLPAQIVEQWEPVYKESHPDISINGYKGEFFDNYVKFGCAEISNKYFCDIYNLIFKAPKGAETNREIESVTIGKGTFTKHQIKEIAKYYLKKK